MNEIERRKLWFEAAAKLNLRIDGYPDWPDRMALFIIARLDGPDSQAGTLLFLESEAAAGRLPTETIELQHRVPGRRAAYSCFYYRNREIAPRVIETPSRIVTSHVLTASAADVARSVGNIKVGPWLTAWLAPYRDCGGKAAGMSAGQGRRAGCQTQKDRVEAYLSECERRAKEKGLPFDRKCMPGRKVEFLRLLHALDVELQSIVVVESLDTYLKQCGCTWPATAGTQESALALYKKLFPEAKSLGVKAKQQRSA